jgi:hypothetical protein
VVGAPSDNYSGLSHVGSVYVYERSPAGTWTLQQKIFPSDPEGLEQFGSSLSLSGDTLVVGAPGHDEGAVHIFSKVDGAWRQQSRIEWYGLHDAYGNSVALSGNTLAVGAPSYYITLGFVDLLVRRNSRWSRSQKLDTDLETPFIYFGAAVAFSGHTLLVGAPGAGVVVLFQRQDRRWVEAGRLTSRDHVDFEQFGRNLAASGDTLIVGAPNPWLPFSGGAYVFIGGGAHWDEQQKLVDLEPSGRGPLGWAVAVRGDTALVGTGTREGGATRGSVLSFERTGTVWGLRQRIKASDGARRDGFGAALALGSDVVVVGAPGVAAAYVLARVPPRSTK